MNLIVRRSDGVPADTSESDSLNLKPAVDVASTNTSQPDDEDAVNKSLSASTAASGRQTPTSAPDVPPDTQPGPVQASTSHVAQPAADVDDNPGHDVSPTSSTGSQAASSVAEALLGSFFKLL